MLKKENRLNVLNNRILWRIFRPSNEWGNSKIRKLQRCKVNLMLSKCQSGGLRWTGHVEKNGKRLECFLKLTVNFSKENQGSDERRMLEWVLKKWLSAPDVEFIQLKIGIFGELLESDIEPLGSLSSLVN